MKLEYHSQVHRVLFYPERNIILNRGGYKFYFLQQIQEGTPDSEYLDKFQEIADYKIRKQIPHHSGFGVVINSKISEKENLVNIISWDKEIPSITHPNMYIWNNQPTHPRNVKREDIEKAGAFCIWEIRVLDKESFSWKEFLDSKQDKNDREKYLENGVSGVLL